MLLFSCNFYTSNGRWKVTAVDLQYLGEVLRNILLYCFSRSFPILWNHSNWFYIKKTPCVDKPSKNFLLLCEKELAAAQFKLTELTVIELVEKLFDLETDFVSKFNLSTLQEDWLLKTRHRLEKYERKLLLKKLKKIRKFARNKDSCFAWLERFESHYQYFCLK